MAVVGVNGSKPMGGLTVQVAWLRLKFCGHLQGLFPCLLEKVLDFSLKFPGPGKSWNLPVVQLSQHAFYV